MMKLFCVSVICLSSVGNVLAEERWWDVLESRESAFGGGHADGEMSDEMKAVLEKKEFNEWVQYEDEYVKFKYPKDDLIKIEVNKPEKGFKVEGGVCTSVDNGFTQAYVLRVGDATYGVFMLSPKEWLDDGICMCGPMVHHAYKISDSTLTRFSLLPGGAVKKAQVVAGGLRLMAFEWTHLACPREVYEEMVASMSIKTRQKGGDEELKNLLLEKYGSEAKLGLVHKGSEASQLEVSFGEASKDKESGVWSWAWKGEDYPCSLQVRVKEGKVEKILNDGIKYDSDNPIKGSLAWCDKVLEKGEEALKFSEKDKNFLKQSITKHLNESGRWQGYRWFTSVDVAGDYCERYKECPSEWLDVVMTSKDGEWYTMDFVETYGADKFGPWMWDVWVNVMRSDKVREAKSYDELHDLGERVGKTNKNKLQKEVANFWGDSDMKAKVAILGAVDALDDKTVEKWLVEILNAPVDRENSSVVYAAMEAIPSTEVKEKQYLLKLLDQIPAGRDNSEWADCRNQAIEFLGGKVEK